MRTVWADHDADRRSQVADPVDLAHCEGFAIGNASIRPSTREVVARGAAHVVEPRVMQVLVVLARAQGGIVSRDDLVRSCWHGRSVGEDAINRVISRLRRLAADCGGGFRIETVTKVGYRLVEPRPTVSSPRNERPRAILSGTRRRAIAGGIAALALAAGAVSWRAHERSAVEAATLAAHDDDAPMETLPADPATASLYLQARADWALRRSDSIDDAIREFGAVIALDPDYAPAYAGLADAYILAREFGTMADATAFPRAKAAASVALRIDPGLAAAERARGFVQYWGDRDPKAAGVSLRRAIALAPADAQSHFWYANILTDDGELPQAIAEFNAARAIDPESIAIRTDWAWALWTAGEHDRAVAALTAIVRSDPGFAAAHDSLRDIDLADHDYRHYLQETAALASLRASPDLRSESADEQAAFDRGGVAALESAMLRYAVAGHDAPFGDRARLAFVASSIGNRQALLGALRDADARHESWGSAGEVARIAHAWSGDPAILALLRRRRAPPVV